MTRVVFLVPRRDDHGPRDRLWSACKARWAALFPDWDIIEGYHVDGPWSRSAALNTAAGLAGDWDIGVVIDADVMLSRSQVAAAVQSAQETGLTTWGGREWCELTQPATEALLGDDDLMRTPELPDFDARRNPISWSCCFAVPRKVWDALGGFDERFHGWGGEDTAFAAAVQGLHGHARIEGPIWNLWHPRKPGSGAPEATPHYIANMRLRDRYAYALRRDYEMHDRLDIAPPDERLRDMANYERFNTIHGATRPCHCQQCATAAKLPDWSDYWPTLPELVSRRPPIPTVALVVHTGGAPEAWPERSRYLRASLASLGDHVRLPRWERKVIWSDWGEERLTDLEAIADEFGLYVKGPNERLGYTGSMQALWRYISRYVRARYVFQVEDDFRYERDVDVPAMIEALEADSHLAQMALLRAPISEREHARGTVLGHPGDQFDRKATHLEHRRFFTVNPMLMRTSLAGQYAWPSGEHSEAVYGRSLFRDPTVRAGLWGDGATWITHTGDVRAGGPY